MPQNSIDFTKVLNFIHRRNFQSALSILENHSKGSSIFIESDFQILRNAALCGSPLIVKHILSKLEKTEISDAVNDCEVLYMAVKGNRFLTAYILLMYTIEIGIKISKNLLRRIFLLNYKNDELAFVLYLFVCFKKKGTQTSIIPGDIISDITDFSTPIDKPEYIFSDIIHEICVGCPSKKTPKCVLFLEKFHSLVPDYYDIRKNTPIRDINPTL